MKRVSIDEITGHEELAKDIINDSGTVLMVEGTTIKKEYAQKLKFLNIDYVYIKDNYKLEVKSDEIAESTIKEQCQQSIIDTIELYASYGIDELTPIVSIAKCIITDVLEQPEVVYNICGIREHSEELFAHSLNVCALSVLIATRMKMPRKKIEEIAIGCLLHDIGITYYTERPCIDESCKTDELVNEYKKHVIYGYSIVNHENWISAASKDIILSHHERLDGTGYPFGIEGKKIKKATRIVSVCDAFDSLVYGYNERKLKVYEAIDYIVSESDVKFDIAVVNTFLDTVAAYPNGTIVYTNQGDKAVVVHQSKRCPTRPVIRLLEDQNGKKYKDEVIVSLVEELTLFIVDAES